MKELLKKNLIFIIPYLFFLILGAAVLVAFNNKAALHIAFNKFHNSFFDSFFYFATFLGDGFSASLVAIMLLVIRFRFFLIVALSNIFASGITQLLKHTVFSDVSRPKLFFQGIHDLYFVPGVENYLYNSFPSGHSTCAFALYFSLALIVKQKQYKMLFFLIAFIAGYSRIYLSQHFLQDVLAGSLIGVLSALLFYYIFQKSQHRIMDKNLVMLFKAA